MQKLNWEYPILLNKDWINSIPKTVNENGCWIPLVGSPTDKGYILLQINKIRFTLSRMVMCIYNNINYNETNIECRHGLNCSRACFNPEHLTYGSHADNIRDTVIHKTNPNSAKEVCPKCGGDYHYVKAKKHWNDRVTRRCRACYNENKRRWRLAKKNGLA